MDYSITQTTLDDVFLLFARLQRETDEDSDNNIEQGSWHNYLNVLQIVIRRLNLFHLRLSKCHLGFEDLPLHSRTSHGPTNQEQFIVPINSELWNIPKIESSLQSRKQIFRSKLYNLLDLDNNGWNILNVFIFPLPIENNCFEPLYVCIRCSRSA